MSDAEHPAVTVVIPTIDRPEPLSRAIDSVFRQDYPGEIECVVVFDGPIGALPDHVASATRTVRCVRNHRRPGLAGSRNTGIDLSAGDLVAFLDDDDEWMPRKLWTQAELMNESDAMVSGCGNIVCYDGNRHVRIAPPRVRFEDLLRSRVAVLHSSTILVRREALTQRIGLVDEDNSSGGSEDYEWQLRAARVRPIAMVPEPLVLVNWHRGSRFARDWDSFIQGLEYVLERNPEFDRQPRGASRIYGQIAFGHAAAGRTREALNWVKRCLRADPRQPRGYLALLVAGRVVGAERVLRLLHTRGRGI